MAYSRHSSNNRRSRNNNRGGNNNRNNGGNRRPQARLNHVYDSNGPQGRVRGTAAQIIEKYTSLANDANASGDKVLQQSFLQHAEHYQRILIEVQKEIDKQNERKAEKQSDHSNQKSDNNKNDGGDNNQTRKNTRPKQSDNNKDDGKMTDVPGFLASDDNAEKKETKPRGRKSKTDDTKADTPPKSKKKIEIKERETEPA